MFIRMVRPKCYHLSVRMYSESEWCSVIVLLSHATIQVYLLNLRHTINHMDVYYTFLSHYCLNMCSAEDNCAHVRTVNTRLFNSSPDHMYGY